MLNRIELIDQIAGPLRAFDAARGPDEPEPTVRDMLRHLTWLHWHAACAHCHQVIVNFSGEQGAATTPWLHSTGPRSCRAAAYEGLGDAGDQASEAAAERLGRAQARPHGDDCADDCPWLSGDVAEWLVRDVDGELRAGCHVCRVAGELLRCRKVTGAGR